MIKYDAETKTVTMDLVDLEHCNFDHDEYVQELFLAGLNGTDKNLQWPEKLVVNFAGGAVKMGGPTPIAGDGANRNRCYLCGGELPKECDVCRGGDE